MSNARASSVQHGLESNRPTQCHSYLTDRPESSTAYYWARAFSVRVRIVGFTDCPPDYSTASGRRRLQRRAQSHPAAPVLSGTPLASRTYHRGGQNPPLRARASCQKTYPRICVARASSKGHPTDSARTDKHNRKVLKTANTTARARAQARQRPRRHGARTHDRAYVVGGFQSGYLEPGLPALPAPARDQYMNAPVWLTSADRCAGMAARRYSTVHASTASSWSGTPVRINGSSASR